MYHYVGYTLLRCLVTESETIQFKAKYIHVHVTVVNCRVTPLRLYINLSILLCRVVFSFHCRASPAPDEWPQAERRLSDIRQLQRVHRSHTLTTMDTNALESELRLMMCPFDHSRHPPLSPRRNSQVCSPDHNHTGAHGETEMDQGLVQVRQSLLQGLSTIKEGSCTADMFKLVQFASMAEENAQNARRLADAAAEMVKSAQESGRSSGQLQMSQLTDSSVDPPTYNHRNYCSIM